jgi:hypothetical protein
MEWEGDSEEGHEKEFDPKDSDQMLKACFILKNRTGRCAIARLE